MEVHGLQNELASGLRRRLVSEGDQDRVSDDSVPARPESGAELRRARSLPYIRSSDGE